MIRLLLLLMFATAPARSALIRGSVLENGTGKPLMGVTVFIEPMPGTSGDVRTMRTGRYGAFGFGSLPAGTYVVKATRRGFIPAEHGQKRWNSAGQPVTISEDNPAFLQIRLARFSAISGTLVDENDIGLPGHEVAVYRATQPPEYLRTASADDRGNYRIGGLQPGKYLVRTVARQYEDGGYLPTFSREILRPELARHTEVDLELPTDHVDVRPIPGRLFSLRAGAPPDYPDITLTLASGMGRTKIESFAHTFTGLPPGEYEVYAEATGAAAYTRLSLSADMAVDLLWAPASKVTAMPANNGMVRIRRRDLAGPGPESLVPIADATVPAGRWELLFVPSDGFYVSSAVPYATGRPDGWVEFTSRPYMTFGFRLSPGASSIHGDVKDGGYAPVYLEGYDSRLQKRVGDLKATRADARGQFRFTNLAPGAYRLLSTFEYTMPSTEIIDTATPVSVILDRNSDLVKDLDLWILR